nr:nitroreductase [Rhodoligotrophos defluvii]
MRERWSCRAFRPDPVPRDTIASIIAAAQHTASWCNTQPWRLTVMSSEETSRFRQELYAYAASDPEPDPDIPWPSYQGVYLDRRREVGWMLYDAVGVKKGDREGSRLQALENFRFFGAPHVALLTTDRALGVYGILDCGGFIQSFMLAALSRGVASIAQAAIASYGSFVRKRLGIGDDRVLICGISFGYPDLSHPANSFKAPRADVPDVAEFRE